MSSVESGQKALVALLKENVNLIDQTIEQDIELEVRYSRKSEFNDDCISDYLNRPLNTINETEHTKRVDLAINRIFPWKK